jgi:hypothetical protein
MVYRVGRGYGSRYENGMEMTKIAGMKKVRKRYGSKSREGTDEGTEEVWK